MIADIRYQRALGEFGSVKMERKKMLEIIIAAIVGAGLTFGGFHIFASNETAENLSDARISKGLCAPKSIIKFGPDLCRELECNRAAQGDAGRPAGCDGITNINNTRAIWTHCDGLDPDRRAGCFALYRERK